MTRHSVPPPVSPRLRGKVYATIEKLALRAALTAAHLLGLAAGCLLRDLRSKGDPSAEALPRLKDSDLGARLAWQIVEILGARLDKIPDRHRPCFTLAKRFQILELKSLLDWNRDLIARSGISPRNTPHNDGLRDLWSSPLPPAR